MDKDCTQLLKELAEDAIYTGKGHLKAGDIRRTLIKMAIWACVISAVLDIMNIFGDDTWLDGIGVFCALALLTWNEREGHTYSSRHKHFGELYLDLYREIREMYRCRECKDDDVIVMSQKLRSLNQEKRPDIPWLAYQMAKRGIKKGEVRNWFADEYK